MTEKDQDKRLAQLASEMAEQGSTGCSLDWILDDLWDYTFRHPRTEAGLKRMEDS